MGGGRQEGRERKGKCRIGCAGLSVLRHKMGILGARKGWKQQGKHRTIFGCAMLQLVVIQNIKPARGVHSGHRGHARSTSRRNSTRCEGVLFRDVTNDVTAWDRGFLCVRAAFTRRDNQEYMTSCFIASCLSTIIYRVILDVG